MQTRSPFRRLPKVEEGGGKAKKGQRCPIARYDTRISKGSASRRCCIPRARSPRGDGSRGASANGRLTPSRIGGARGSGAASDGRRQSSPPSSTDKPSRLRPSDGCPVGSLRRPRVPRARPRTYHFFGDSRRGNILALALYPRSLFSHPFDLSHHRQKSTTPNFHSELASPATHLFNPSSFRQTSFNFNRSLTCHPYFIYLSFDPVCPVSVWR